MLSEIQPRFADRSGRGGTITIVAFGDSLTAGDGLSTESTFPIRLAHALTAKGTDAAVIDAGVNGDTAADGLARLDQSVPAGADAVILEFGANDALRRADPAATQATLAAILAELKERKLHVLLAGMLPPPNFGGDYLSRFSAMYRELANQYDAVLYPFFLDGLWGQRGMIQADGLHPTAAGVDVIVERIMPKVDELCGRVAQTRSNGWVQGGVAVERKR